MDMDGQERGGHAHSFAIAHQWDGSALDHPPIRVSVSKEAGDDASFLSLRTEAPFFDDAGSPAGVPGQPFDGLWDYEVVEAFFLGDEEKYLEVELCPHGQHLVLLLDGVRKFHKVKLPLDFQCVIDSDRKTWRGTARIPLTYLPPGVSKFNAYAIHGSADSRVYESLYYVPKGHFSAPDFHRLEYFGDIDMRKLVSGNPSSELWESAK